MPATFNIPTQNVIAGQLITAVLWNGEYQNLYDNFTPAGMDDYAATDAQFQIQTDPFPSSIISKPTSLAGELERIRYEIAQLKGTTYHYQPSTLTLAQAFELYKPGMVIDYAGSAAPTGWLLCDGSAVSRTTYAALFAVIGTTFGSGDGSTTFNVPDGRGRTIIGAGTGSGLTARTLAAVTGAETHVLSASEHEPHTHSTPDHFHLLPIYTNSGESQSFVQQTGSNRYGFVGGQSISINNALSLGGNLGTLTAVNVSKSENSGNGTSGAKSPSGAASAHNNMQPSLVLNRLIKT